MKQITTPLVASALLAAASVMSLSAAEATNEAAKAPEFTAYAWSGKQGVFPNIVPIVWIKESNATNPASLIPVTRSQPQGRRVMSDSILHRGISSDSGDRCVDSSGNPTKYRSIWWDHGVEKVRDRYDAFFKAYKEAGGELDVYLVDFEGGITNWHLKNDPEHYAAIQNDPRFAEIAKTLGFSDLGTVAKYQGSQNYLKWNALMRERRVEYMRRAIYEPIRKYFPEVKMSNYCDYYTSPSIPLPERNGHLDYLFGKGGHLGTHQSLELYGRDGMINKKKLDGVNVYEATPFNLFRYDLNKMRSAVASSEVPLQPWISHKGFAESHFKDNDYYQEVVLHAGLTGADDFLLWNPRPWKGGQNPEEWGSEEQDRIVSNLLKQLSGVVSASAPDRKTLTKSQIPWNTDYVLSGINAGKRSIWRFTPKLEKGESASRFLIQSSPATFQVGKTKVVIPGGKVLKPEPVLSSAGFWIKAPLNAEPRLELLP